MLRGFMAAAVAAAAFSFAPVGAASAATLDEAAALNKGFAATYEAGAKVYVYPAYRYHYKPRVVVRPYVPVYPVYKVKRPKVYVY